MCMTTHAHKQTLRSAYSWAPVGSLPSHLHPVSLPPTSTIEMSEREREKGQIRIRSASSCSRKCKSFMHHSRSNRDKRQRGSVTFIKGRTRGEFFTWVLVLHTPVIYFCSLINSFCVSLQYFLRSLWFMTLSCNSHFTTVMDLLIQFHH